MSYFEYKARNARGEEQSGQMEADDTQKLALLVKRKGLTLVSAEALKGRKKAGIEALLVSHKVGIVDKMLFTRNLAVMLRAGLPFGRALNILSEQTKSPYFKEVLLDVAEKVERGDTLADSLNKYPKVFNQLFVSMVRVGETSGNLEEVLDLLAIQLKKDYELTSKVKGAMTYPLVIIGAMAAIGVLMILFVIPKMLAMFTESGAQMPFATRVLIFVCNVFQNYGIFLLGGVAAFGWLFMKYIHTSGGKKNFDDVMLKLPVIGPITMKVNVARFGRTLSSMVASGVSIVQALDTVSQTLGNYHYKESAADACRQVQKGTDLSKVVAGYGKLYPSMMIHMIEVGEETGSIEKTLKQVAEFYEEEVDQFTGNLATIIEPVIMLIMGIAVGFFAIAMIQPMYSVMQTV